MLVFNPFSNEHERCGFGPLGAEFVNDRLDRGINLINRIGGGGVADFVHVLPNVLPAPAGEQRLADGALEGGEAGEDLIMFKAQC